MSLAGLSELPELGALASTPTSFGTTARAEIDEAKLRLYRDLQKRHFRPSSEELFDRRKAKEPVLDFTRLVWLTLARDKVLRSGSSRVDRNAITEETLRVFLEEPWLARYLAAETNAWFKHLVETIPEGTPEFWRRFAINNFLDLDRLSEELELQIRVAVLRADRVPSQAAPVDDSAQALTPSVDEKSDPPQTGSETEDPSGLTPRQHKTRVFATTLKRLFDQSKMLQKDYAEKAGFEDSKISKYLAGKALPGEENKSNLIRGLGITPKQFEAEIRITEKQMSPARSVN